MNTTKPKRPTPKIFVVSDDTHKRLKEYATKKGYKLQFVAHEAGAEYLKRKQATNASYPPCVTGSAQQTHSAKLAR